MLPVARLISGSSTANVAVLTVVVSPDTVRFPEIVTLSGNPTVIVPELSETSTSLVVPAKVIVPPNAVAVVFDPSETVIVELLNEELPMFDNVLSAPLIVLLVSVSVPANVANEPSDNAVLNCEVVPDTVLEPNAIVLLVKVCDPVSVETVESIANVTVLPEPDVSIPVPPVKVIVSESKSIDNAPPESAWKSKSSAVSCVSTYALIDCWVAKAVALFDDMSSSSLIAEPETDVLITGLVKVLFVRVFVVAAK